MDEEILQEIQEIKDAIGRVKPQWGGYTGRYCEGKGYASESIFIVQRHRIFWVVLLATNTFAYKEVSPEWLETFGTIITASPIIFVEYDKHHKIREWSTIQGKVVPVE